MRAVRILCLVAVALIALPVSMQATEPATAPAPSAAERIALEDLLDDASATEVPADDEPLFLDGWSCPTYSQICSTDAQCDAFCGGAGLGSCEQLGSPIRKCCFCIA